MRILTRYILGEISSHALIGCALFTFILLMKPLEEVLDMVVRNSSSAPVVLEFFVDSLPNTFLVTIPMAVLMGVLLGLSRLAADSEITAMRASGLGIWYFVRVGSVVAVLGTALGLVNSLLIEPAANRGILDLRKALETSQGSFEIQPRVFYEDFKNTVVYVQNVRSTAGVASWGRLFIADVTDPATPGITTAESATVVSDAGQGMMIRLRDASVQQIPATDPGEYNVSTYSVMDQPLTFSPQSEVSIGRLDTPLFAMPNSELMAQAHGPDGKRYLIELHRRFAYPVACIVLMLIGVPLGAASRRGGKSGGFVVALCVVLIYYLLSNFGIAWAKQGRLPAFAGVWLANIVFAVVGLFLLSQLASGGAALSAISALWTRPAKQVPEEENGEAEQPAQVLDTKAAVRERYRRRFRKPLTLQRFKPRGFPLILDEYVLREFLKMFSLILAGFVS